MAASASTTPPKVIYFDIGGVCVLSPFQAILDFESQHNIPHGWVNVAISRSAPNGAWQRLERGEFKAERQFFELFEEDLRHPERWREFYSKRKSAGATKAADIGKAMGKQSAMLSSQGAPGAIQEENGKKAAEGTKSSHPTPGSTSEDSIPPPPDMDVETLFWSMMNKSQTPDPSIFPAVQALRKSSKFIVGALSNTSLFPDDHPLNAPKQDPDLDVRSSFDVFISSAHSGMRKPEKRIYEYAMQEARRLWKESGREEKEGRLEPGDVLFLDDIGENLRMAKSIGWRTIRVKLGQTKEAVRELERETGMSLLREEGKL